MNTLKPIRPTELEFKSELDHQKFLNYASNTAKTNNEEIERARQLVKAHKPAKERK